MPEQPKEPGAPRPTPPEAAGDKPVGPAPAEPLKGEVSRTDAPGAGASAAPMAPPRAEPPAPKPANPAAARTATTSETSSATGQPTAPAAKPAAPAAKPAATAHAAAPAPPSGPPDPPPPAGVNPPSFITTLQASLPGGVSAVSYWVGDWTIIVPVGSLLEVATHLREAPDAAFDLCSDVTVTDWPPR